MANQRTKKAVAVVTSLSVMANASPQINAIDQIAIPQNIQNAIFLDFTNSLQTTKDFSINSIDRFIRIMIAQIVKKDTELKTFTCRIQDFAKFFGIAPTNLYSEVESLCTELLKCQVHIGTGNPKRPWKKINWFDYAEYNGEGGLTLCLGEQMGPYVLELNK